MSGTYLDRILVRHRERAARDRRSMAELVAALTDLAAPREFRTALTAAPQLAVIAEIKRRSPSKGDLAGGLDPAQLAAAYEAGGAACLSVLTDHEFFDGSPADLGIARAACSLPALRKDFTVDERDIADARRMGADAVLLIVAALDSGEVERFHRVAVELGLDVLVEVHDEAELDVALAAGATLIGVNQRDLFTFAVDHDRAVRMASLIPAGVVKVAESGVSSPADASRLREVGYDAVLVGEHLVTSGDPAAAVRALAAGG